MRFCVFFEFLGKFEKLFAKQVDSKYDDYRDFIPKAKTNLVNNKLQIIASHEQVSKLDSYKTPMDSHATSLYPSATWDKNSVFPKIGTRFSFWPHMNDVYVKPFNDQTFNQNGDESAKLKIKHYNPPNLIFQQLPVKEKLKT